MVREVIERSRPVVDVARENGVAEQTLRNWVGAYRGEHREDEPPLGADEREKLRRLEKENRELRQENEFLGKAAAFFAKKHPHA